AIGNQAATSGVVAVGVDRGQSVAGRERDNQLAMNRRRRNRRHDQTAIRGARECSDGTLDLGRSCTPTGRTSTPNDGAAAWITANWAFPAAWITANWAFPPGKAAVRRTAARVTRGAISLSSSSHFAAMLYSNKVNPVTWPPGCARLST